MSGLRQAIREVTAEERLSDDAITAEWDRFRERTGEIRQPSPWQILRRTLGRRAASMFAWLGRNDG